jgi:hypothetical protein
MTFFTIANARNNRQDGNLPINCYRCGQSGNHANPCMNNSWDDAQLQETN